MAESTCGLSHRDTSSWFGCGELMIIEESEASEGAFEDSEIVDGSAIEVMPSGELQSGGCCTINGCCEPSLHREKKEAVSVAVENTDSIGEELDDNTWLDTNLSAISSCNGKQNEGTIPYDVNRRTPMKCSVNLPKKQPRKASKIHKLIRHGKWDGVRKLLHMSSTGSKDPDTNKRFKEPSIFVTEHDEECCTALALVCIQDAPYEIIYLILAAAPIACSLPDSEGSLPLHHYCKHGSNNEVLGLLIETYSKAASVRNISGYCPLQLSLERTDVTSPEWFKQIVKAYPYAAAIYNDDGELPLHYGGKPFLDEDTVRMLINAFPLAARCLDRHNSTPLRSAWRRRAPPEVVEAIFAAAPSMAKTITDAQGNSSVSAMWHLHFSYDRDVAARSSEERERRRVKANKIALRNVAHLSDLKGRHKVWWTSLESLLRSETLNQSQSQSQLTMDDSLTNSAGDVRWNFLHAATRHGAPPAMIEAALRLYKHQIRKLDEFGMLPLHHAATGPVHVAQKPDDDHRLAIDMIIKSHKQGVIALDRMRRLPLHHALENGRPWHLGVKSLVEVDPKTILCVDEKTGLYPFMSAAVGSGHAAKQRRKRTNAVVRSAYPDFKRLDADDRRAVVKDHAAEEDLHHLNTVFELLRRAPQAVSTGVPQEEVDEDMRILRRKNARLRKEHSKLRKQLTQVCKELNLNEKMHRIERSSLSNEIAALQALLLSTASPSGRKKGVHRALSGTLGEPRHSPSLSISSALRRKSDPRYKYRTDRVKFMGNDVLEFSPEEGEFDSIVETSVADDKDDDDYEDGTATTGEAETEDERRNDEESTLEPSLPVR